MKKYTQDQVIENLKKCHLYNTCSRNLCPLDLEIHLRVGGVADKCRYMRNAKSSKINGHNFLSGGSMMPDASLNFVPSENVARLNEASRARWQKLKKNEN